MRTEYHVSGENRTIEEDSSNIVPESSPAVPPEASAPNPPELPSTPMQGALNDEAAVQSEVIDDTSWGHHDEDGRVNAELVAEHLAALEDEELPDDVRAPIRTHLLAHQRTLRAFSQRRELKR